LTGGFSFLLDGSFFERLPAAFSFVGGRPLASARSYAAVGAWLRHFWLASLLAGLQVIGLLGLNVLHYPVRCTLIKRLKVMQRVFKQDDIHIYYHIIAVLY